MPEMSSGRLGYEVVPEACPGWNGALADVGRAVHVGTGHHVLAVPVQSCAIPSHHISRVHYHPIALANLKYSI